MTKMTERKFADREKNQDAGVEELATGLADAEITRIGRRFVDSGAIIRARGKTGLSQLQFATLLRISVRTLQEWEQGRREPSAAAQTLIKVAERHPNVLREIAGGVLRIVGD